MNPVACTTCRRAISPHPTLYLLSQYLLHGMPIPQIFLTFRVLQEQGSSFPGVGEPRPCAMRHFENLLLLKGTPGFSCFLRRSFLSFSISTRPDFEASLILTQLTGFVFRGVIRFQFKPHACVDSGRGSSLLIIRCHHGSLDRTTQPRCRGNIRHLRVHIISLLTPQF